MGKKANIKSLHNYIIEKVGREFNYLSNIHGIINFQEQLNITSSRCSYLFFKAVFKYRFNVDLLIRHSDHKETKKENFKDTANKI